MGVYLELAHRKDKAGQILARIGGEVSPSAVPPSLVAPDKCVVCVIENASWDAAIIVYDDREYQRVVRGQDGRPWTWLILDREKACSLAGIPASEIWE